MATHASPLPVWTRRNATIAAAPLVVAFLASFTVHLGVDDSRVASTYTSAPVEIEIDAPSPPTRPHGIDPAELVGVHHFGGTGARIILDASGHATTCIGRMQTYGTWRVEGDKVIVEDNASTRSLDVAELMPNDAARAPSLDADVTEGNAQ